MNATVEGACETSSSPGLPPQLMDAARATRPAGQSCMKENITVPAWPFGFYKVYNRLERGAARPGAGLGGGLLQSPALPGGPGHLIALYLKRGLMVCTGEEKYLECRPFLSPLVEVAGDLTALPADCPLRANSSKSHT